MHIIHKDATIVPTGDEDAMPGTFEVILSAPTKDRDGDTLLPGEWKTPLPARINFDSDHGMSVATTVGSGVPSIDEETGNLIVHGTYSSLPRAQEVRTLVNEGHIDRTSVAFMTVPDETKGVEKGAKVRELLSGAFVAIPSNREALVLASKSAVPTPADVFGKAGARNSKSDAANIQAAHDAIVAAGATCGPMDDTGAAEGATGGKTFKATTKDPDDDAGKLAQGVDAVLDQALDLLDGIDLTTLPAPVQQAIALLTAAEETSDELQDALGVPDPDDEPNASEAPAEEKDALSLEVNLKYQALMFEVAAAAPTTE